MLAVIMLNFWLFITDIKFTYSVNLVAQYSAQILVV